MLRDWPMFQRIKVSSQVEDSVNPTVETGMAKSTSPSKRGQGAGLVAKFVAWRRRSGPSAYLYILPATAIFGLFIAFPFGFAVWLSMRSWNGFVPMAQAPFVGFGNYKQALNDPIFHHALFDTILFTVVTTLVQMLIAFFLAFTLWYFKPRFYSVLRALYFFPAVLSMIVVGLVWRQLLGYGGPVDRILSVAHVASPNWLGSTTLVMWVIIWVSNWQWSGWSMILFLAGMVGLPQDVMEASLLDGASSWVVMKSVVVPMLRHVFALVLLLNVVGGFQVFDTIYILTAGGPDHASETLGTYSWWTGFSSYGPGALGYAAAIAVVMVSILFIFSFFRVRASRLV
jgi:ABC-type sugar transport system permease subunit